MSKVMNKKFKNVDRKTTGMFKDHISLKFYPFISLLNSCYSNLLLSRILMKYTGKKRFH